MTFLVPKLPAPKEEDLSKGILEAIDMDSYRAEKKAALKISLPDEDAEIGPVPTTGGGRKPEPELDRLSNILKSFNEQFGTLFTDADRVAKRIKDDIAPKVAADQAYQNAKKNTPNTARIEHDNALARVVVSLLKDDTELYKQFFQNESFRRFVTDMVFNRNCLACFGPFGSSNFAVFQAFAHIRKNRRLENQGVLRRGTSELIDFMEHETLNKYFQSYE